MNGIEFALWIEELRALPASSPQWVEMREFITAAADIIEAKENESVQATELTTLVDDVRERFSEELAYLRRTLNPIGESLSSLSHALQLGRELKILLNEYGSIRTVQPKSFDEEERLSVMRREAGVHLRDKIDDLNALLLSEKRESHGTETETAVEMEEVHAVGGPFQDDDMVPREFTDSISETESELEPDCELTTDLSSPEEKELQDGPAEESVTSDPTQYSSDSLGSGIEVAPIDQEQVSTVEVLDSHDPVSSETDIHLMETGDEDGRDVSTAHPNPRRHGIEEATESAQRFLATSSLDDLETLMWSLIAEDDVSGAYWMATYLSEEGFRSAASPLLLKAIQGTRWLSSDVDKFVTDLFGVVSDYDHSTGGSAQELLEFAAAIQAAAVAPHSQMLDWLKTPGSCPSLEPIVRPIGEMTTKGISLRPEYVRGLGESVTHNAAISSASRDARQWLDEARKNLNRYGLANSVWRHLTSDGGQISNLLGPVIGDTRGDARNVQEMLAEWSPESVLALVGQTDRELEAGKNPKPPIAGDARKWLLRRVEDATTKAGRWCRLVEEENEIRARASSSYLMEQVTELRAVIQASSQPALEALTELSLESTPMEIAASAICAKRSLQQLLDTLDIEFGDVRRMSPVVSGLESVVGNAENLEVGLARRLLWIDSAMLDDEGLPFNDSLVAVIDELAKSVQINKTLVQAFESRMDRQDYRFLDSVFDSFPDEMKNDIKTRREKAIEDSRATLEEYMRSVERRVRRVARDGVIEVDDANWMDCNGKIEGIRSREDTLNFSVLFDELQRIEAGLQDLSESRYSDLCEEWELVLSDQPDSDPNAISSWNDKFDSAKGKGDIRVMEECLMRLRTGSTSVPYEDVNTAGDSRDTARHSLENFITFSEDVHDIEAHTRSSTGLNALRSQLSSPELEM